MPTYEVRRQTVMSVAIVEAADEMGARIAARDVWQTEAGIASLTADVVAWPNVDPADAVLDARSELRYEETDADREAERRADERWLKPHALDEES